MKLRSRWRVLVLSLAALLGCGPSSSRLVQYTVTSRVLGEEKQFSVLEPPASSASERAEIHVVYLLHGWNGNHRSLDEEGLSDRFFSAQVAGRLPRVLLVMPDGEQGFYLNWHDGSRRYEDYILEEVIPAAEARLGLEVTRARRHLVGVSMGGYGALNLGLGHPELFASAASISGVIFNRDRGAELAESRLLSWTIDIDRMLGDGRDREFLEAHNPYDMVAALAPERRPRLFVAAGDGEPGALRPASEKFHSFLDRTGVRHDFEIFEGGHGWEDWAPVIERAVRHAVGR